MIDTKSAITKVTSQFLKFYKCKFLKYINISYLYYIKFVFCFEKMIRWFISNVEICKMFDYFSLNLLCI